MLESFLLNQIVHDGAFPRTESSTDTDDDHGFTGKG